MKGGYISIGYVYDSKDINVEVVNLVLNLLGDDFGSLTISYSNDVDGNEWHDITEINSKNIYDVIDKSLKLYYAEVNFKANILGFENISVLLRFDFSKDYSGILMDLYEEELIKSYEEKDLDEITNKIIEFIINSSKYLNFDYSFCDKEAEIKYSLKNILKLQTDVYSVLIINKKNKQEDAIIKKGRWHINGMTSRNI